MHACMLGTVWVSVLDSVYYRLHTTVCLCVRTIDTTQHRGVGLHPHILHAWLDLDEMKRETDEEREEGRARKPNELRGVYTLHSISKDS